jgi:hypothetical protein
LNLQDAKTLLLGKGPREHLFHGCGYYSGTKLCVFLDILLNPKETDINQANCK